MDKLSRFVQLLSHEQRALLDQKFEDPVVRAREYVTLSTCTTRALTQLNAELFEELAKRPKPNQFVSHPVVVIEDLTLPEKRST